MQNESIEKVILSNLIRNEVYTRKVLPFIKAEYFTDPTEKVIFQKICSFFVKYNSLPTKQAILIDIESDSKIAGTTYEAAKSYVSNELNEHPCVMEWLLEETEKFCQSKAVYNAVVDSVDILNDKTGKKSKGSIPELLQSALSVSFDSHIGHSYMEDADKRFDFYHTKEEKLGFDLKLFNKITGGGIPKKTLNCLLASTGGGKSLAMCHIAANHYLEGSNVLYITLEMSENKIAERIDANLLNVPIQSIKDLSYDNYKKKLDVIKKRTVGKLVIKEYPTSVANVGHFRHLLQELKTKQSFKPDVIFIDYLNLASSVRVGNSHVANTYVYIKAIAEELRGLAVEHDTRIWTATQTNRSAYGSSDVNIEQTSESVGLPATVDLFLALISTEELEKLGQIVVKQLKNRYNDISQYRKFVVGIDRSKMRLFDVSDSAQTLVDAGKKDDEKDDEISSFDKTSFGSGMKAEKKTFDDFKF